MADITASVLGDITDPKVRKVLQPIIQQAQLAAEKVAAHHHQPKAFLLPKDPKSLEGILQTRFAELPQQVKSKAANNALASLAQPASARASRVGELAKINLASAEPIETQMRKIAIPKVKLTTAELLKAVHAPAAVAVTSAKAYKQVELRLHRVRCVDETNGWFGSEAGSDEIHLAGSEVDESGDTHKIKPFKVASFDDGDVKTYSPPRRFCFFNLGEGTKYPKSYFVTFVMAEVDMGGLPDFVDKLYNWVKGKVITALTAYIGGMIGASGGPIGAIIGVAVGWAVGKVYEIFKSIWEDEVFPPTTARLDVPTATHRFPGGAIDSSESTAVFSGHGGKYELRYDWRLFDK
ncbi:MAG TPA: hypothetical protein VK611_20060 [Acidimicrobiales bacterium]|nr:hypothetical protein [Acidimicrobiales bacterium]